MPRVAGAPSSPRSLPPRCWVPVFSYHQQGEHGLPHVEAVPPVVVGDPAVALAQGIHEPHQGLRTHTQHTVRRQHRTGAGGGARLAEPLSVPVPTPDHSALRL